MPLSFKQLRTLGRKTAATLPTEITCDEWLGRVARYLEAELANEPIPIGLEAIRDHLEICPECAEEYEAMKVAMKALTPLGQPLES